MANRTERQGNIPVGTLKAFEMFGVVKMFHVEHFNLFANTKFGKDVVENVLGCDNTDNLTQGVCRISDVESDELTGHFVAD
jgi:hypothetical protein